jgi:uncharacterized protein (TIGR00251 family)
MIVGVRVVPNSSRTETVGWMADGFLKIKLAAPPVDGEANRELVFFLAKTLGLPKNDIEITNGLTSKKKTLRIPLDEETLTKKLGLAKQTPLL